MKKRKNTTITRFIAYLLTLAISISSINVTSVFAEAEENDIVKDLTEEINDYMEETEEAIEDSASLVTAGNWYVAIKIDHLSWNAFHNRVQEAICEEYENKSEEVGRELEIIYGKNNKESLRGKKGRADIYMKARDAIYLWEIKPYSYSVEPKKTKAIEQLDEYVKSKSNYRFGGSQIANGVTYINLIVQRDGYTEHVEYEITYEVRDKGLILYRFERHVTKRETNEKTAVQTATETVTNTITETVIGAGAEGTDDKKENDSSKKIDIKKIVAVLIIEKALKAINIKINASPQTNNTVSATIIYVCEEFERAATSKEAAAILLSLIATDNVMEVNAAEIEGIEDVEKAANKFISLLNDLGCDMIIEQLQIALQDEDEDKINELIEILRGNAGDYDKACKALPPSDPLVIDLGEPCIDLYGIEDGVYFDMDCNGFTEKTAWIGIEDGFLAIDRNGNGSIDDGSELFGDQTVLSNGMISLSGFEVLAESDTNQDGTIDCNDMAFEALLVWIDDNHNGKSESGELHTLNELGIISFYLNYQKKSTVDTKTGIRISNVADIKMNTDGCISIVEISEFLFPSNRTNTLHEGKATTGNVPNIFKAINGDETGSLYELVFKFNESEDIARKHHYVKQILYFITGANDIDINSRGGNIDARDLKVIEEFMGHSFSGVGGTNPNTSAAAILKEMYCDIEKQYYNMLNMYAGLGVYLKTVYETEDINGEKILNMSLLYEIIDTKVSNGENIDVLVYDLGAYFASYDEINGTGCYEEYANHIASLSSYYMAILKLLGLSSLYIGTAGADSYSGTGSSEGIFGEEENDTLNAGGGDDIIIGGQGNDVLNGGSGADTYIFNIGDGEDIINNYDTGSWRRDKILFGEGISKEDIRLTRSVNDMIITNTKNEEDVITLCNAFKSPYGYYYIGSIEFADGTIWDLDMMKSKCNTIYGTEENDTLGGYSSGYNYQTSEVYYGGAGDDNISGGSGNDILVGGAGNDVLNGGDDADTYIFNIGDGEDIINNYDTGSWRRDKILFGEGILEEDIRLTRCGNDMIIENIKNEGDVITLCNAFKSPYGYYYIGSIEFADGTVWDLDMIKNNFADIKGTEENDILSGYDSGYNYKTSEVYYAGLGDDTVNAGAGDDIIYGEEGNDTINGGSGNDILVGGVGNDVLNGGDGADTYIFNIGDGTDTINNYDTGSWRRDKIMFGEGILEEDIRLTRSVNDMIITNTKNEGDVITLCNAFKSQYGYYYIGSIEFADGTVWDLDMMKEKCNTIYGTKENDTLVGYSGGYNYQTSEVYYGGAGEDTINGGSGNDILVGGAGNDVLNGGDGADTYIFNIGDETDIINNYDTGSWRRDKILFGEGISEEDIILTRCGNDMVITNTRSEGDVITLCNAFKSPYSYYFIGSIEFADGIVWDYTYMKEIVSLS
ncbi:MAG: hypothetical protein K2M73_11135 [Lachnospiraceae bacterium]|nr:hypothetical protein [Lachnospiraceae bacterium]